MKITVPSELQGILLIDTIVFLNNRYEELYPESEITNEFDYCGFTSVNEYLENLISMVSIDYKTGNNMSYDDIRYIEILIQSLKGSEVLISMLGIFTNLDIPFNESDTKFGWKKDNGVLYVNIDNISSQYVTSIIELFKNTLNSLLWFVRLELKVKEVTSLIFAELTTMENKASIDLYTSRKFEVVDPENLLDSNNSDSNHETS